MLPAIFSRGFGCHPDQAHKKTQKPIEHLLGGSLRASVDAASLEQFEAAILDQGQTPSCTGHGTAQLNYIAFGAMGKPLTWIPSPKITWDIVRCRERPVNADGTFPALTAVGGEPADITWGLENYGFAPMAPQLSPDGRRSDVWGPFDTGGPSNIADEPPLRALEQGAQKIIAGEYRIDTQDPALIDKMCATIEVAKAPLGVGGFVDTTFMQMNSSSAPLTDVDLSDPRGGGHWFAVSSFRTDPATGKKIFRGPNSWGLGWGHAGHLEVTEDWIRKAAWDVYAWTIREIT